VELWDLSEDTVDKWRKEQDTLELMDIFGLTCKEYDWAPCVLHGGIRITDRQLTCLARTCFDIGGQAMVDHLEQLVRDHVTANFHLIKKEFVYKCSGLHA
jgi:hypothetical protein